MLKKKDFKDQMDKVLVQYIFPEFNSPHGHLRARVNIKLLHNYNKNVYPVQ